MKFIFLFTILFFQIILGNPLFKEEARISLLNFGLDITNQSNSKELYKSVSLVPIMIEKEFFDNNLGFLGFGIYISPFIEETYHNGYQQFDELINSYFINLRLRYSKPIFKNINAIIDIAHGDGNLYKWKNIIITWLEFGVHYRVNYTSRVFLGYKYTLNTNENKIDFDGLYINFIFGHSFIRK